MQFHHRFRLLLLSVSFVIASSAQPPEVPERTDPHQVRVNLLSLQTTGNALRYPGSGVSTANNRLWYTTESGLADVSWILPGERSNLQLNYVTGYSWNPRYTTLRGFDHALTLSIRREPSRLTSLRYGANVESRLVTTALFDTGASLALAQTSSTVDDLEAGLANQASGIRMSPVDLALFGARITTAAVSAGFSHTQSPKLQWTGNVSLSRMIRGSSADPIVADQYPSATVGEANGSAIYSLSRRTRIAFGLNYMYSRSRRYEFEWEQGSVDLQRLIGRRTFAHWQSGFGRVIDRNSIERPRNSYTLAAGVGSLIGAHTMVVSLRRGGADYRGVGLGVTLGVDAGWSWTSAGAVWHVGASGAYERLQMNRTGADTPLIGLEARVLRATLTRRLTLHTSLAAEVAHVHSVSRTPMLLAGGGLRVVYSWNPRMPRRQPRS